MLVSYVPVNGQRSTFPFPYVHHQPDNRKVGQLLTVEKRTLWRANRPADPSDAILNIIYNN